MSAEHVDSGTLEKADPETRQCVTEVLTRGVAQLVRRTTR